MATLGDLITYVKDFSADMADGKADRLAVGIVNDALRRVRAAHAWSRYVKQGRLNLALAVAGTNVSVTSGGTTLTFAGGETASQAYVDDEWEIRLAADQQLLFKISAIAGGGATATLTEAWIGSTVSSGSYAWIKSRYDLPTRCFRVYSAKLHSTGQFLYYLPEHEFDAYKQDTTETLADPTHFTLRGDRQVDVWPALAATSNRQAVLVTYEQYLETYTTASSTASVIDWYAEWDDLLHRALDVEIAAQLPQSTRLSFDVALLRFENLLQVYKGRSNGEVVKPRTNMTLGGAPSPYWLTNDWALRRGGTMSSQEV